MSDILGNRLCQECLNPCTGAPLIQVLQQVPHCSGAEVALGKVGKTCDYQNCGHLYQMRIIIRDGVSKVCLKRKCMGEKGSVNSRMYLLQPQKSVRL